MSMIGLGTLVAPVNQLDGSANQNNNCAGAVLAWSIRELTGASVAPETLKDAAYGAGYLGETAIPNYRAAVAVYGLTITERPATLAAIDAALGAGHPIIVAIPSDWGDTQPNATTDHFVCIAQDTGADLRGMNPWGGFWQAEPATWWAARFRLGTTWELSASGGQERNMWTIERDGSGNVTGAHDDHGAHVGAGFAWELTQHTGWLASDAIIGESYYASGQCVCALQNGVWMDWSHAAPATVNTHSDGGAIVAALYQLTAAAARRIQQLQAELSAAPAPPPPAPAPTLTPAEQAAVALVSALHTALG